MVDVEQHALRAFEQYALAVAARLVEVAPDRPRERQDEVGDLGEVALQSLAVDGRLAEAGAQRVMVRAQPVEHRVEVVELRKVAHADRAAADLVLISGADAAAGGADLAGAARVLAQRVEVAVDRQDQRAIVGNHQHVGSDRDALLADALDLGLQRPRVEHDAIADHRRRSGTMPLGSSESL